ncbi:laminin subunit gamma-1-like [Rhagoletis pomonella]|uniref:laminin subunit gamma-1-like n=1 Tax=Rhagoletis pomonella TaxID=28610 RepID=UPI00177CD1AA|nr:laminin subunit gamma-1-like [Rhagoletis pomonella]
MVRPVLALSTKMVRPVLALSTKKCMPEFINAAYQLQIEATNTCGENGDNHFYILQFSLQDAEIIRKKANDTKVNARKLRNEADQLNHRVQITENSIAKLDESANKDDSLVDDAKRKVGQAKAGAQEAQGQIDKSIQELDDIKEELENLKDINVEDLDKLESRLDQVEFELNRVNLTGRIEKFRDLRNAQKKWIDKYEKDLYDLEKQVENISAIAQALPNGCYPRSRLEP